jgi:DNA-dependent RNA polymerase auxiliary subunit epsilon
MSRRTRTIQWCEGKIVEVLSKKHLITTDLALSALVLKNVRSINEQHNYDIALSYLLSRKTVKQEKDSDGFTVFRLVA